MAESMSEAEGTRRTAQVLRWALTLIGAGLAAYAYTAMPDDSPWGLMIGGACIAAVGWAGAWVLEGYAAE